MEQLQFNKENVVKMIDLMYGPHPDKKDVNKYLMNFQTCNESWGILFEILSELELYHENVSLFMTTVLKNKILMNWRDICNDYTEFRNHLLGLWPKFCVLRNCHMIHYASTIAQFITHSTSDQWSESINDMVFQFASPANFENLETMKNSQKMLLFVLTDVPKMMRRESDLCKDRNSLRQRLLKQTDRLRQFLEEASKDENMMTYIVKCLGNWYELGMVPLNDCSLLPAVFKRLLSGVDISDCCNTMSSLFLNLQFVDNMPDMCKNILLSIGNMQSFIENVVQQDDQDDIVHLTTMMVSCADHTVNMMLQETLRILKIENPSKQDAMYMQAYENILSFLLGLGTLPNKFPCSQVLNENTMMIWHDYAEAIYLLDKDDFQLVIQYYEPKFFNMMNKLIALTRYPDYAKYCNGWNEDEKEAFRCYRQDVQDTLMNGYPLFGESQLEYFKTLLQDTIGEPWQNSEAMLYAISALLESLDLRSSANFIYEVFTIIQSLDMRSNTILLNRIIEFAGACSSFYQYLHTDILEYAMTCILEGLLKPESWTSSSFALKDIVSDVAKSFLKPYICNIFAYCWCFIDQEKIPQSVKLRVISIVGLTILQNTEIKDIEEKTKFAINKLTDGLKTSVRVEGNNKEKISYIVHYNELVTNLLYGLMSYCVDGDYDPTKEILGVVLNMYPSILSEFPFNEDILKSFIEVVKKALRSLSDEYSDFTMATIDIFMQPCPIEFQVHSLPFIKNLICSFGDNVKFNGALKNLFKKINMENIEFNKINGYAQNPDVLEAYLTYMASLIRKTKCFFRLDSEHLGQIFEIGLLSLSMQESSVVKQASVLLAGFICLREQNVAVDVIENHGGKAIKQIFMAVSGTHPRSHIQFYACIINSFNMHFYKELKQWLEMCSQEKDYPRKGIDDEDKKLFAKNVLEYSHTLRGINQILEKFTLKWRGMAGSEYGMVTSKYKPHQAM